MQVTLLELLFKNLRGKTDLTFSPVSFSFLQEQLHRCLFHCGLRDGAFITETSFVPPLPLRIMVMAIERRAFLGPNRHFLGLSPDFLAVSGKMLTDFNKTWILL